MKRIFVYAMIGIGLGLVGISAMQDWEFWAVMIPFTLADIYIVWRTNQ